MQYAVSEGIWLIYDPYLRLDKYSFKVLAYHFIEKYKKDIDYAPGDEELGSAPLSNLSEHINNKYE